MLHRRFGRTELSMPVLTCGGMRYQHQWTDVPPADIPKANQENLERTIHRALELGINHIETARGYGTSEMQLGWVLPKIPREKLIVQTKVSPFADPKEFLATFEKSMAYLGLEYVDLLSFHGINNRELLNQTVLAQGCLKIGRQLQKEGRARFLGFSTHAGLDVIQEAINTAEFDYVNLHWYWVNDRNWPAILDATRLDMGVFIISPNDKGGKLYEPPDKLVRLCDPLSPMVFNDLYCLQRPEVHTLSIGAARPSDFDEHIKALELFDQAETLVPPIDRRLRQAMKESLGEDWLRDWEKGIPEWEQVPGHINIWEIIRLWNYAKALDLVEFAKMRYNLLGNGGHWFPGLNASTLAEHNLLPCLKDSPYRERIVAILAEAHTMLIGEEKKRLSSA
ncbi:MAG: aldo/keto reductase [Candidatus Methylacidiphilales bacterium]|nr:aldo/keto reductase [Candidatus Methylacidiphilales bacterium]